jgi:uncharacterized protein (UPF0332 family)
MTLNEENRNALVTLRLEKAKEAMSEAIDIIELGHWRVVANRLYYACFYAASALLIQKEITAHTHSGVINQFGLHYVEKGLISREQNKLYGRLFSLRQTGDYDDWVVLKKNDVIHLVEPVQKFIEEVEK